MFSVVQISDSHVSPRIRRFNANWQAAVTAVNRLSPDLVVHTGDATLDGADSDDDCAFAARGLAALAAPVRVVPGNHDVGDGGSRYQPATQDRLARFERHFGPASWTEDRPGWRLIGLNSQAMGAGDGLAQGVTAAIAEALRSLGDRRLAVFLHKPALIEALEEGEVGYWAVPPAARGPLALLLTHPALRLVASGHLHVARLAAHGPATLAWCPATGFLVGEKLLPDAKGGVRQLGLMRHVFRDDVVETEILPIPEAEPIEIDSFVDEIYPPERG
ncbi:MAG: metallophosphoesterase [Elioraea sp.]|nr:metallophosphoesterase [Elioraea sp.]